MMQTAPAARRFVTLRASGNNVMRKLEVHSLLVRRFVTLRVSENDVMRKLENHKLFALDGFRLFGGFMCAMRGKMCLYLH